METESRSNSLIKLLHRFSEFGKAIWKRRATTNELGACDALELRRIAHELGISVADLRSLARRDKTAADLLYRRLETLRLNPASVDLAVMRDLQRCCSNCDSKQLCAHELEDRPTSSSWPKYCPNEHTIAALTAKPTLPR